MNDLKIYRKTTALLIAIIILIAISAVFLTAKKFSREEWVIGKTRDEIVEKYGSFDLDVGSLSVYKDSESFSDALWRYYMGGSAYDYLYIRFDDTGIAREAYKDTRPGG